MCSSRVVGQRSLKEVVIAAQQGSKAVFASADDPLQLVGVQKELFAVFVSFGLGLVEFAVFGLDCKLMVGLRVGEGGWSGDSFEGFSSDLSEGVAHAGLGVMVCDFEMAAGAGLGAHIRASSRGGRFSGIGSGLYCGLGVGGEECEKGSEYDGGVLEWVGHR